MVEGVFISDFMAAAREMFSRTRPRHEVMGELPAPCHYDSVRQFMQITAIEHQCSAAREIRAEVHMQARSVQLVSHVHTA